MTPARAVRSREAILAIDQGTSGSKAALYDTGGRMLALARVPIQTRFGPRGRASQSPTEILSTVREAIRRALMAAGGPRLLAAGIASQRSTFVLWDPLTGRALGAAPTWQSTESAQLCRSLASQGQSIERVTGLPLSPHYSASKLSARLSARGDRMRGLARRGRLLFGSVATFLIWRMTRGEVHATDPGQAQRSLLLNLRDGVWDARLMQLFNVPRRILPEVRPSLSEFGQARIAGRSAPIVVCLGDQQAALIGALGFEGAGEPGEALASYGTGAFLLVPTGRRRVRAPGLLTSVVYSGWGPPRYALEGTVNEAGALLERLKVHKGRSRGAMQAIALAIAERVARVRDCGLPITSLRATGGLSTLAPLMRIQASVLGIPVRVEDDPDAALRGVATAVAFRLGIEWKRGGRGRRDRLASPSRFIL